MQRSDRYNRSEWFIGGGIVAVALIGCVQALNSRSRTYREEKQDLIDHVDQTLSSIATRLSEMERTIENLPKYGQGVIDGIQLRQSATAPEHS